MKNFNLGDYQISTLCQARHDLQRAFIAYYKTQDSPAEVDRVSSSFILIDEALEDEIQQQEAIYDALLHEQEKDLMPQCLESGEDNIHLRNFKMNNE